MWNRAMFGDSELHARDGYMAGTGLEAIGNGQRSGSTFLSLCSYLFGDLD